MNLPRPVTESQSGQTFDKKLPRPFLKSKHWKDSDLKRSEWLSEWLLSSNAKVFFFFFFWKYTKQQVIFQIKKIESDERD